MEFEKKLFEILKTLEPITKAGVIEMIFRLEKEDIKIGDFSRKYRMHSKTAKEASEILIDREIITLTKDGRKKILSLTVKGHEIPNKLRDLISLFD